MREAPKVAIMPTPNHCSFVTEPLSFTPTVPSGDQKGTR